MSSEAIGAAAHGGEDDVVAVADPLHLAAAAAAASSSSSSSLCSSAASFPASFSPSGVSASSPAPVAAPTTMIPASTGVPMSTTTDNHLSDLSTAAAAAAVPPTSAASGVDGATGLHSPPDSNNATKLDGSSSDSELSDLDDDVLAQTFSSLPPDDADAPATSVTTPTTAPPDTATSSATSSTSSSTSSTSAASAAPCSSSSPSSGDTATNAADGADAAGSHAADIDDIDDIGEIEPDHFSGTVPVFRPTMPQFRDFKKFMEKIDKYGMKSGIVKIIPPQEWKDSLVPLDEMVKAIKVREPIKQDIMGSNGTYRQVNILHQRTYNLPQWRQLCDQSEHQPPARRGERRANADKPKPAPRGRAAAAANAAASAGAGAGAAPGRRGRRGRGGARRGGRTTQQRQVADDDTASVVSEPRPMTPESQRGDDDEKMALDDDQTCVGSVGHNEAGHDHEEVAKATCNNSNNSNTTTTNNNTKTRDKIEDEISVVVPSVEVDRPIKQEEDDRDMGTMEDDCTDQAPAAAVPRRMGFTRQASAKTQSTSARRKYIRREGSAKIDEAAFKDWDYRMDVSDYTPERCEELERSYWKTLTYAPPLYGADLPGTLFDESTELWNLNKLPNLLDVLGTKVPGVNTAYLYLGMWKATFAWHLEDVDLYSINYLHFGAPKQWYSISQGDARRFEAAMKNIWPADAKACNQFLRHKAFLISPSHLQHHYNIRVNKCVSYPGEFVVTYPYGYHSGYNLGYNCAEAVNFALDSWLPMGKIAKKCECAQAQDSVWVDVYEIERKLRGIPTDDEDEDEDEDDEDDSDEDLDDLDDAEDREGSATGLPTPPTGSGRRVVRIRVPATRKRKRITKARGGKTGVDDALPEDDNERRKIKKMRLRLWSGLGAPCCLCPNDLPDAEMLPTDDGRTAHRICASYLPETYIETIGGKEVVTNVSSISLARMELRCMYCRLRKGVCLQCSYKKCSRSYHATCAAAAGVFVEEADVPVFGEDGTEYKERVVEFICRFQRTKRDKKYDGEALEKSERIRTAAAALQKGALIQMQLYRCDIFAGFVMENRPDEENVLLRVIPSGEQVEVEWKWLLLPDSADYRLPRASPNALPLPASRKEKEELNAQKRPLPVAYDIFVDGYTWKEFHACDAFSFVRNKKQAKVDLSKPDQLWHYIGESSTETKAHYTDDPSKPVHNRRSNPFPEDVPKLNTTLYTMQPPRRPSLPPGLPLPPGPATFALPAAPTSTFSSQYANQTPGQPANQPSPQSGVQTSGEPRRSYSVIKPPYVPHTSPGSAVAASTPLTRPPPPPSALPASSVAAGAVDRLYAYNPQKPFDNLATPRRPSSKSHSGGFHHQHHHNQYSHHQSPSPHQRPSPFGSSFALPKGGHATNKFPQIQHPNLSHGYTAIPTKKSWSSSTSPPGAVSTSSASSASTTPGEAGNGDAKIRPPPPPPPPPPPRRAAPVLQTSTSQKYPFFAVHGNRDASTYRSPYAQSGGFTNHINDNSDNNNSSLTDNSVRSHTAGRQSGSGAAALAAAAAKLHKRSASSASSASSFSLGLGVGLKGLTRPSTHTNYVGPPPPPSSTASSPYLSGLHFGTGPGSPVSSYASYDSLMHGGGGGGAGGAGGPHMSPQQQQQQSPAPIDSSPFVGSPGPQMGAFDFPSTSSASSSAPYHQHHHHPGMRPQFGGSWQQSFAASLGSFAQDMDLHFSPPSPMSSALGLPGSSGLGAPANIIPNHQNHHNHQNPFSLHHGSATLTGGSPLGAHGFGSLDAMSPPLLPEAPMDMSPPLDAAVAAAAAASASPADAGTSQSPADQLKQQLRSISDSSLPSTYRLRCLHQPRRRHQSRSSLNRIFTSQLLDFNPT